MTVSNIESGNHIVRYCSKQKVIRKDGIAVGIHPLAFYLKINGNVVETYLSVCHYEHFDPSQGNRMSQCKKDLPIPKQHISPDSVLVRVSVDDIHSIANKQNIKLRVTKENSPNSKSYAAIRGLSERTQTDFAGAVVGKVVEIVTIRDC